VSKTISDDDVDTAMRTWARQSVNATSAPTFAVAKADRDSPTPRHRRLLLPALAAAVVLLLVAAGLVVRQHVDRNASTATGSVQCPTRPPTIHVPAGTDGGLLFARPVAAMAACSYSTMSPRTTRQASLIASVPLDHQLASRLAHQLNTAPTTHNDPLLCLHVLSFSVLVARDDHGTAVPPITLTPGCREITATNGTTTRYLNVDDPAVLAVDKRAATIVQHPRPAHT
jgi:hypothetical protein